MTRMILAVLCVLLLGGCPVPMDASPFPAGIYSGELSGDIVFTANGEVVESNRLTEADGIAPRTAVINGDGQQELNGLIVGPGTISRVEAGEIFSMDRVITDVTVSGDVILTRYEATLVLVGYTFTGPGEWIYKLRSDGDID